MSTMKYAAEVQAQERANRDKKKIYVWLFQDIWYVRTEEEGRPKDAVLMSVKEPE